MGLAAGQARLLSITARKSDCEFQSMRLSHQKIAMARELADISNEYQNSLTQTKLVYDYYGTGDTSTPLTYGLMMQPSALNDYMPILLTSTDGRVVLNNKLALAAAAAGIPQEGLGTLPSEELRNRFIQALGAPSVGVITSDLADRITTLPYNQGAGFGSSATVLSQYKEVNYDDLMDELDNIGATINISLDNSKKEDKTSFGINYIEDGEYNSVVASDYDFDHNFLLSDILKGDKVYLWATRNNGYDMGSVGDYLNTVIESILDQADECFQELFGNDAYSQAALEYARTNMTDLFLPNDPKTNRPITNYASDDKFINRDCGWDDSNADYYMMWSSEHWKGNHRKSRNKLSITNMLQAYITYIADYLNGVAAVDDLGAEVFDVKKGELIKNSLAKDNKEFLYKIKAGTEISSDNLGQATFYDAMFNQICANGWVENDNVDEKDYLQQMLQSSMMFVSRTKDDGCYYQGNYATDSYIKVITDESAIAYAEAKYNTEKSKLNAKEETIDLKMKNLDTEISSLTTEYDTVKNTISKNIEKSFKRYSA